MSTEKLDSRLALPMISACEFLHYTGALSMTARMSHIDLLEVCLPRMI